QRDRLRQLAESGKPEVVCDRHKPVQSKFAYDFATRTSIIASKNRKIFKNRSYRPPPVIRQNQSHVRLSHAIDSNLKQGDGVEKTRSTSIPNTSSINVRQRPTAIDPSKYGIEDVQ
ncbi:hypothetical protein PENTCL1PPCAC_19860, partial [Pristionchus entomophagus]